MSKTINTLIAIMIVGIFPAMALYQQHNMAEPTQEGAVIIAEEFLKASPTFNFDGIEDSVEIVSVETLRTPFTWEVTIRFTSRHGGYGDRTGQMVTQALQDHQMRIVVRYGKVVEAMTDDVFNELTGETLNQGQIEAEAAKEIALDFLTNSPTYSFDGIEGTMQVVEMMIAESYPVQYFITITFDCTQAGYGDRTGMMLAQVITTHEARVVVVNGDVTSAILDDIWDELIQRDVIVTLIPTTETVVATAIDYLKENYPEMADVEVPEEWALSNLNPEGLLGAMKIGYSGLGWDIEISWAVVLEPVYSVTVSYGENSWSLTVDQSLTVEESI